jgi:hypothetical protein
MNRSDFEYLEGNSEYGISGFLLVFLDENLAGKSNGIFLGRIFQSFRREREQLRAFGSP